VRLIALLPCLTGAWRHRAGGLLLSASGWFKPVRNDAALQRPDLLGARRPRTINMSTIGNDLLRPSSPDFGPRIEALVVYNSNPVAVAPESAKVVAGFRREDLFTVVLEHFLTDTADHADYVLPATTQLEHWDVHTSYGHTYAMVNEPALSPRGQALSNCEIFRRLAARMGFDDPCLAEDDLSLCRQAFSDTLDFERLREQGWQKLALPEAPFAEGGFPTPSGKAGRSPRPGCAELRKPCITNWRALPSGHDLPAGSALKPAVVAARGEPCRIHPTMLPRVACRRRGGVVSAAVTTARTAGVPAPCSHPGVWWRKLGVDGTNVNELTSQRLTDIGRAPTFYDCLVEVAPA
jgi:anaerobic selenocysteine-containing dehydrogenase